MRVSSIRAGCRVAFLFLICSALLVFATPDARAKKAIVVEPRLSFAHSEPISIPAEDPFLKAVPVEVINPTNKPIPFSAELAMSTLDADLATVVKVSPDQGRVPALGATTLSIEVIRDHLADVAAGSYSGELIVTETRKGARISRELVVDVARPLVKEQTITVYRGWPDPFGTSRIAFYRNQDVPLEFGATNTQAQSESETVLGIAVRDKGGTALIESDGAREDENGVVTVRLSIEGSLRTGTYKGSADLTPSDAQPASMAITVIVTDLIVYPILALLIGLGAALAIQRWTGAGGRLNALGQRLATIEADLAACRQGYSDTAKDVDARWDIAEYLAGCAAKIRADLQSVRRNAFASIDAKDEKELADALDGLEREAQRLDELAVQLRKLDEAIGRVREEAGRAPRLPMPPGSSAPTEPRFIDWAIAVLRYPKPSGPCDLGKVADYREKVVKATALAQAWPGFMEDVPRSWAWVEALDAKVDTEERKLLEDARRALSEAEWELWNVTDADDLDKKTTKGDLADATRFLSQLNHLLGREEAGEGKTAMALNFSMRGVAVRADANTGALLTQILDEPDDPVRRVQWLRSRRRIFDTLILYVLLGGAVYAGLQVLYFDKPFGTPRDYLNAFAWGLGSKAVVDIVASSLDAMRRAGALAQRLQ